MPRRGRGGASNERPTACTPSGRANEGWLYLAVVIDLFARRVVGWAAGDRLHKELALLALRRAVAVRCPSVGLIHHADRGRRILLHRVPG